MTDLIRFAKRLVEVLEARDPVGVHRPLRVADLRETVFPYRSQRSPLGLTSSEDYELLVLRLVSEEDELVRTFPAESAEQARAEVRHPNPNLDLVEKLSDTTIQIGATALARILAVAELPAVPKLEFLAEFEPAPPPPPPPPPPAPEPVFEPLAETIDIAVEPVPALAHSPAPASAGAESPPTCRTCHAALPARRAIAFCPFCGGRQQPSRCSRCETELEPGWRHCIECGLEISTPGLSR